MGGQKSKYENIKGKDTSKEDDGEKPTSKEEDGGRTEEEKKPIDYERIYLRAEYNAIDKDKSGKLTTSEFIKLLMFLGYAQRWKVDELLKSINKDEDGYITIDEYFDAMENHPGVKEGTSRLRDMFAKFDDNKDGRATKVQILEGLEDMGIEIDNEIKDKVSKMDTNNDGKVFYEDFVQSQLIQKGVI